MDYTSTTPKDYIGRDFEKMKLGDLTDHDPKKAILGLNAANLTKNDFKIVITMLKEGCTNTLLSYTTDKIADLTGLSRQKVRNTMLDGINLGWIAEGARQHRHKTYYVTEKGKTVIVNLTDG